MPDTVYQVVRVGGGFAVEYEDSGTGQRTQIGFQSAADAEAWIAERKLASKPSRGQSQEAEADKS